MAPLCVKTVWATDVSLFVCEAHWGFKVMMQTFKRKFHVGLKTLWGQILVVQTETKQMFSSSFGPNFTSIWEKLEVGNFQLLQEGKDQLWLCTSHYSWWKSWCPTVGDMRAQLSGWTSGQPGLNLPCRFSRQSAGLWMGPLCCGVGGQTCAAESGGRLPTACSRPAGLTKAVIT